MRQKAETLLPNTVVKAPDGELGVLIAVRYDSSNQLTWIVNWERHGTRQSTVSEIQKCELA
jgi:hypothetical protein